MAYISSTPKSDRDSLLRGQKLDKIYGDDLYKMPFRNLFIDGKDLEITDIVFNYFDAIRKKWPGAWEDHGRGMMLNRTNGFRALMRFLRHAYLDIAAPGEIPSSEKFFQKVLDPIELNDADFSIMNFVPGSGGEARLYRVLRGQEALQA